MRKLGIYILVAGSMLGAAGASAQELADEPVAIEIEDVAAVGDPGEFIDGEVGTVPEELVDPMPEELVDPMPEDLVAGEDANGDGEIDGGGEEIPYDEDSIFYTMGGVEPADGELNADGEVIDGEATDNGEVIDGEVQQDGEVVDVEVTDDGEIIDGEVPGDSEVVDGDKPGDGEVIDGEVTDGEVVTFDGGPIYYATDGPLSPGMEAQSGVPGGAGAESAAGGGSLPGQGVDELRPSAALPAGFPSPMDVLEGDSATGKSRSSAAKAH